MDDLFALFWKVAGAVVVALGITIGGCTSYQSHLVSEAIKGGADPIAASCAIGGDNGRGVCLLKASGK